MAGNNPQEGWFGTEGNLLRDNKNPLGTDLDDGKISSEVSLVLFLLRGRFTCLEEGKSLGKNGTSRLDLFP